MISEGWLANVWLDSIFASAHRSVLKCESKSVHGDDRAILGPSSAKSFLDPFQLVRFLSPVIDRQLNILLTTEFIQQSGLLKNEPQATIRFRLGP